MRAERKYQDRIISIGFIGLCVFVIVTLLSVKLPPDPQRGEPLTKITNPLLLQFQALTIPIPERKERAFYLSLIKDKAIVDEVFKYKGVIDLDLLVALIWSESRFKPTAINKNIRAGRIRSIDSGLLQLNSAAYPEYTLAQLQKLDINISLGVAHFQKDLIFFKGDVRKALQAFNAGRTRVLNYPNQSVKYAAEVLKKASQFKAEKAVFITKSL